MKAKHAIILLALGLCAYFVGVLFKILHYPGADVILITAITLLVMGVSLFTIKLLAHPRIKRFLNS